MDDSLVAVRVGDCSCPESPHADGDFVYLAPHLTLAGGLLAESSMLRVWSKMKLIVKNGKEQAEETERSLALEAGLREVYVVDGVRDWNFVDEDGEKIEVDEDSIRSRLLSNFTIARPVGDKADELYSASVLDPLLARMLKSSRTGRRPASTSTSRTSKSSGELPTPLKRSSTATTDKERLNA